MRFSLFLLAVCALGLSACSNARETFGLTSAPPDEFAVVDHPPLSMPPDYALHPPKPGEAPFQAVQPSQQAAQTLGVGSSSGSSKTSSSEQALLSHSGSQNVDPNIRNTIDHESTQQTVANRKLIDAIMFWREPKKAPSLVVDAAAERKRLEEAKNKKEPVTTGATPVIGPKQDTTVQ
ncbi:MAG: DUF3035 domain-containing protein [Proteobacteria bacterium]|nr:DUF3035 domain-containing protein [Pseudomonadota bacterium]